jgi:hypothetical protein
MVVGIPNQDYGDDPHSHKVGLWLLAEVVDNSSHFNEIDCFWNTPYAQFIGSLPPKLKRLISQFVDHILWLCSKSTWFGAWPVKVKSLENCQEIAF